MRMSLNEWITGRWAHHAEETVTAKALADCNCENFEVTCLSVGEQINETVKQRKTNPVWSHLQVESEKAVLRNRK